MTFAITRAELVSVDDSGDLQTGKALGYSNEEVDGAHLVRQHGFASHAPAGSHGVMLSARGERSLPLLIGFEHQDKRPKNLTEGQAVLYDATGNAARMLGDDGIWHDAGTRPQKITGSTITITGTTKVVVQVGSTTVTVQSGRVDLGGLGGSPVMTQAGLSSIVFAKL